MGHMRKLCIEQDRDTATKSAASTYEQLHDVHISLGDNRSVGEDCDGLTFLTPTSLD